MGSGSSFSHVDTFDKAIQMPPVSENNPRQRTPSESYDRVFVRAPKKPKERRMSSLENEFELNSNIEEYSIIWDHDTKASISFLN
jgi:hypothetical protein